MIVCLIPARGGSKRIPRKNIRMFHGKPIIAYSIEAAKQTELFDAIVISTDDAEIAEVAKKYGADVWMRDPALADDLTGTQEVAAEFLRSNKNYDEACVIYATAPLMSVGDLEDGWELLGLPATDFAFSVGTEPSLHDAGQFYWGRAKAFTGGLQLVDRWTRMIPVDPARDCDINTEEDWQRAEQMYAALHQGG